MNLPGYCFACDGRDCEPGQILEFNCHQSGPETRGCTCVEGSFSCVFKCFIGAPAGLSAAGFASLGGYAVEGSWKSGTGWCNGAESVFHTTVAPDGTFALAWPGTPTFFGNPELTFTKDGAPAAKCRPKNLAPNATTPISPETCLLMISGTMP